MRANSLRGSAGPHGVTLTRRLAAAIRDVRDFPREGIVFKDLTPALRDSRLFPELVEALADPWASAGIARVAGVEARGFLLAGAIAGHLSCGLVPLRKPGKLPWRCHRVVYDLEYGTDVLEAHEDAFESGDRVLIVDDVLATGGTARAASQLVRACGANVTGAAFLVELGFLGGRHKLEGLDVRAILTL